jgi:hypothetical protein
VASQEREAAVSPYVNSLSPELLWKTEVDGWNLLGFRATPGRHAEYSPGSADLPKVIDALRRLALLWCPDLPQLKRAERRWEGYVDEADLSLLRGETLLRTDYSPDNVLIDGPAVRLIDWAWPTLGAAFIDPSCLVVRLIFAGHTPEQAEACVMPAAAWHDAPTRGVNIFATALARMWIQIAEVDPNPWKRRMAASARSWEAHRHGEQAATRSRGANARPAAVRSR